MEGLLLLTAPELLAREPTRVGVQYRLLDDGPAATTGMSMIQSNTGRNTGQP
jgi:hypothetical protein